LRIRGKWWNARDRWILRISNCSVRMTSYDNISVSRSRRSMKIVIRLVTVSSSRFKIVIVISYLGSHRYNWMIFIVDYIFMDNIYDLWFV